MEHYCRVHTKILSSVSAPVLASGSRSIKTSLYCSVIIFWFQTDQWSIWKLNLILASWAFHLNLIRPDHIYPCCTYTYFRSIVSFCLETIPELKGGEAHREWSSPFFWIEFCCCLWFSVELILRFVTSPSKSSFMKSFLNILVTLCLHRIS